MTFPICLGKLNLLRGILGIFLICDCKLNALSQLSTATLTQYQYHRQHILIATVLGIEQLHIIIISSKEQETIHKKCLPKKQRRSTTPSQQKQTNMNNTKEIEEDDNCQCNVWGLGIVANLFSSHGKSSPCSDPIATDDESSCNSDNDNDDIKVDQAKPAEGYDEFLKFINPQGASSSSIIEERQEVEEDPTMAEIQLLVDESDIPQAKVDEMFIVFEGKEKKLLRHLRKLKKSKESLQ